MLRLALAACCVVPAAVAAQAAGGPQTAPAVAPPAITLPLKYPARPTLAEITAGDLMSRVYLFADDSMLGRESGTIGNVRGTDYIAREVARLGLRPAGENGGYFQVLPFRRRSLDAASVFMLGDSALVAGRDFAQVPGPAAPASTMQVVYGGVLGDGSPRIAGDAAVGKLVVYRVLPSALAMLQNPANFPDRIGGMALVGLDPYIGFLSQPSTVLDDPSSVPAAAPPVFLLSQSAAARAFSAPLASLTPGTPGRSARVDIRVRMEPVEFPSRNVIAILPGSDPTLAAEYVAIGAHNDHVGFSLPAVDHDSMRIYNHVVRPQGAEDEARSATPEQQAQVNATLAAWRRANPTAARRDSINNGADDDASGSMTVLEIAERMARAPVKPRRSVLFVWHTGEEKGLLGAQYFTRNPTVPRDAIVAQLNLDMVGRGNAWDVTGQTKEGALLRGSPDYLQLIGSRRLSTELGDLIEQVNRDAKLGFRFDYAMDANGHSMNIYCRSDHYEYARHGIPITFFTTGGHSDYHQVTDEPQYIDYPHMARVAQLVDQVAWRIANQERRLVVDKARPDPKGACQQ